jgi:hypothetical protein
MTSFFRRFTVHTRCQLKLAPDLNLLGASGADQRFHLPRSRTQEGENNLQETHQCNQGGGDSSCSAATPAAARLVGWNWNLEWLTA